MFISKKLILIFLFFLFLSVFVIFRFSGGNIGDYLVTNYDELRYLFASDKVIQDTKNLGILFTLENFYNYSQSIHFLHYFILAFFRYFFNDSMVAWSIYQICIYTLGCYYFGKFLSLEYDFISSREEVFSIFLMLCYPVFYFLTLSLMRDIAIFTFLSICLYLYKSTSYKWLILFLIILSLYRINMMLCLLVYIIVDQFKGKGITSSIKYLLLSVVVIFIVDIISMKFISRHVGRISELNILGVSNEVLVFIFSPLPFSVDESLPFYLRFWFMLSFWMCLLLSFLYILFILKTKNLQLVIKFPMICLVLVYITTYSLEAGIGFRQSSILLPFLFIPIFIYFLKQVNGYSRG